MHTHRIRWLLSFLITVALTHAALAGQPRPTPPNVAQVDMVDAWVCPPDMIVRELPLDLSLTTRGGPVMVSYTVNVWAAGVGTVIILTPLVDQGSIGADVSWFGVSRDVITLTRAIDLPAGTYTFGAQIACQYSSTVTRAWLTAYELPTIPR
jgi:hypothetical protein